MISITREIRKKYKENEPIFTSEILELFKDKSPSYIFKQLKKEIEEGLIIKFDKGIYFIPINTIIGPSTITIEDVINKKYLEYNDEVFGIYSGLNLENMFSLTTQVPNSIEVVSNNIQVKLRKFQMKGRNIVIRKSRCKIDKNNYKAYTIVELFSKIKNYDYIQKRAKLVISKYIKDNEITKESLLEISKEFPKNNIINSKIFDN